jgi:hypothetical protein
MAIKIVQTVDRLAVTGSPSVSSGPIALKSGYLRISVANTGAYVAIGTDPVANVNSFHVPNFGNEVLKERLARQQIAGITTGTTTVVTFFQNAGNPFKIDDYVTIEGAPTVGINTTHNSVLAITDSTVTLNFDSSSVVNPNITGSTLARSIKIAAISSGSGSDLSIAEVVQLVSE